jgi:hypothetical protein
MIYKSNEVDAYEDGYQSAVRNYTVVKSKLDWRKNPHKWTNKQQDVYWQWANGYQKALNDNNWNVHVGMTRWYELNAV